MAARLYGAVSPLEGFGRREWVCFERALVVRDMFLGGERTFLNQEDARAFRSMIYAQYGEGVTHASRGSIFLSLSLSRIFCEESESLSW